MTKAYRKIQAVGRYHQRENSRPGYRRRLTGIRLPCLAGGASIAHLPEQWAFNLRFETMAPRYWVYFSGPSPF